MTQLAETTLEVERVVAGGDGLARHESLVVFVPRTLPGERVRARATIRGHVGRGELVGVDVPSHARVTPQCPHYDGDQCGGCQLQHASYDEQLRIKSAIVVEAFRRIAHIEVPAPEVRPAGSPWRYRRKLTLALRKNAGGWYAGLRRRGAPDDVFDLRDCLITDERVMTAWREIRSASPLLPDADELRGAVQLDSAGVPTFALEGGASWGRASEFFAKAPSLGSLWYTPVHGRRQRLAARGSADDSAPDASFIQVNEVTAAALLAYALERVRVHSPATVVDAYAGSGQAAVALAANGIRATAIELDRDAAHWAERHLAAPSRVIAARVEDVIGAALPADVVLLNPPRTGVHARVCEAIVTASPAPRAVIYVSCDPATLARDVSRMTGYRVASLVCFDMFPQTAHVESVCELVPAAA